jgi:Ca2+-binding EF-hand superfamily protein
VKNVTVEIERSKDCHTSTWHGWFDEKKYDGYEKRLRDQLEQLPERCEVDINPGPRSLGITCEQNEYNPKLWHSKIMDQDTRRWRRDQTFSYPRIGAFEVFVKKGTQRIEVFSKLKVRKWPNLDWLVACIEDTVEKKLGGWGEAAAPKLERKPRSFAGINGKAEATDEDLRGLIKAKFSTLVSAFRSFDKNGDGQINRQEFFTGLKQSGVDLPKEQMLRLWEMADEDGSGVLHYTEFARKFAAYKATHSLHRHASMKSEADAKAVALHGVAAGSRMAKTTQHRSSKEVTFGVDQENFDPNATTSAPKTLNALARQDLSHVKVEDATPDELRAKIIQRQGNLLNAFRQMDNSGDSRICYEEFQKFIPKVIGEPVPAAKLEELWRAMDEDLTGEIDIAEFASAKLLGSAKSTSQGVKVLKDLSVDPTAGQKADHQKVHRQYSGLGGGAAEAATEAALAQRREQMKAGKLARPESASTVATASATPTKDLQ